MVRHQLGSRREARAGGLAAQLDMLSEGMRAAVLEERWKLALAELALSEERPHAA